MGYELGITKSAYSKIERDETDVNLSRLLSIAKVLEVNVTDFFDSGIQHSKAEDPLNKYGFATKSDVEELVRMIKQLANEVEQLKLSKASVKRSSRKK